MEILYQDDAMLVVNKPSGLPVLSGGWEAGAPSLIGELEERFGTQGPAGRGIWVVHRLDRITSGVIAFARSAQAHRELSRQFEQHDAEKVYHAIGVGVPAWEEKLARHPLRADVGHRHRTVVDPLGGKPSETLFRVLRRGRECVLFEVRPRTGRTHQVRAHAAALGHPLLGDLLYGAPPTDLIARPALHAHSLTIRRPDAGNGSPMTFTAAYPPDFQAALECLNG